MREMQKHQLSHVYIMLVFAKNKNEKKNYDLVFFNFKKSFMLTSPTSIALGRAYLFHLANYV